MRVVIVTVLLLALAAAAYADQSPSTPHAAEGNGSLTRYRDEERGVTCWKVRGADGLSCLPDLAPQCQRSQAEDSRGSGNTPAGEQFQGGPTPASTPTPRSHREAFEL